MRCCICVSDCKAFTTSLRKHEEPNMRKRWIFIAPLAILGILLFITIGGEVVLQLWDWLLPPLFRWRQITFWQAGGVLGPCWGLFRGFCGPPAPPPPLCRLLAQALATHSAPGHSK